jgi:hypothetical protein
MSNFAGVLATLSSDRDRLESELEQLNNIIRGLEQLDGARPRRGRRRGARSTRRISAEGRARIAAAQRERWAKVKKAQGATPIRTLSAAARKKIAAAQRARWAKVKSAA